MQKLYETHTWNDTNTFSELRWYPLKLFIYNCGYKLNTQIQRYVMQYSGVIMSAMASQITGVSIVCSTASSEAENTKVPYYWPSWGEATGGFPSQKARNAGSVSIWWSHHGLRHNKARDTVVKWTHYLRILIHYLFKHLIDWKWSTLVLTNCGFVTYMNRRLYYH